MNSVPTSMMSYSVGKHPHRLLADPRHDLHEMFPLTCCQGKIFMRSAIRPGRSCPHYKMLVFETCRRMYSANWKEDSRTSSEWTEVALPVQARELHPEAAKILAQFQPGIHQANSMVMAHRPETSHADRALGRTKGDIGPAAPGINPGMDL
jgi:hypothetical protein